MTLAIIVDVEDSDDETADDSASGDSQGVENIDEIVQRSKGAEERDDD